MKTKVSVGIIGTGVGLRTHLPAFVELADAEVVALAGSSLERGRMFADQYGVPHALSAEQLCESADVDLVCVTSPNQFHYAQTMRALKSGKHVLCEKPLAMDEAGCRKLATFSGARPNQLALVNHQLRFNPYLRKVKQLLAGGYVGRPYLVRMHQQSTGFSDRNAAWSWSFDADQGGGVRLAMGSHLVDLLVFWFGSSIDVVNGSMDPVIDRRLGPSRDPVQVRASGCFGATISFSDGPYAQLSATAAAHSSPVFEFSIYGEDGELHFDLDKKLTGTSPLNRDGTSEISAEGVRMVEQKNEVSIFSGSFPYYAEKIIEAIKTHNWSFVDGATSFEGAVITQIVLDALQKSASSGLSQCISRSCARENYV